MKQKDDTDYLRGHGKNIDDWLDAADERKRKNDRAFYLKAAGFFFIVFLFVLQVFFDDGNCYDYDCPDTSYQDE